MAYQTLPHQDYIAENCEMSISYSTLISQFGDGYAQTAADGINNKQVTWGVAYTALDPTLFDEVMSFIDSVGGHVVFLATPRGEAEQKWRIVPDSVKVSHIAVRNHDQQVYRTIQFTAKKAYI